MDGAYLELPYLAEGQSPEGEERGWGYRLDSGRGYLYLAPLSGEEIYVQSDCVDAEGLADKRGLTPRPYRFSVLLERQEDGWAPREGSASIGLMSGHEDSPQPERQRLATGERLDQFGHWLVGEVATWAGANEDKLRAAERVQRHNRAVDLKQDIAVTEGRLERLRTELQGLELAAMDDALASEMRASRPQLSDDTPTPQASAGTPSLSES